MGKGDGGNKWRGQGVAQAVYRACGRWLALVGRMALSLDSAGRVALGVFVGEQGGNVYVRSRSGSRPNEETSRD